MLVEARVKFVLFILRWASHSQGLSQFLKAVKRKGVKGQEQATSGLGGIEHQKLPHLILQVLFAIDSASDGVLPRNRDWLSEQMEKSNARGPANTQRKWSICVESCVVRAGFAVLDLHYTLRRAAFTRTMCEELKEVVASAQFHMLRMHTLKQVLVGSNKQYQGIKYHLLQHFPECIAQFGPTSSFDMIHFEHAHCKYAKQAYPRTSRRKSSFHGEMYNQARTLASWRQWPWCDIHAQMFRVPFVNEKMFKSIHLEMLRQKEDRKEGERRGEELTNTCRQRITLTTDAGIVFEEVVNRPKLMLVRGNSRWTPTTTARTRRDPSMFIHPSLSFEEVMVLTCRTYGL